MPQRDLHGGPPSLVEACGCAAEDEDRHASIMGALARSRGGAPSASRPAGTRFARPLDLALDNVSVGVVRDTFGALMALHQATAARDADVRDAMRAIANDECAHAEFSASIDAWLMTVLDVGDHLAVGAAREGAIRALEADVAEGRLPLPAELRGADAPRRDVAARRAPQLRCGALSTAKAASREFLAALAGRCPADSGFSVNPIESVPGRVPGWISCPLEARVARDDGDIGERVGGDVDDRHVGGPLGRRVGQ
jgi:hypothetical protein